MPLDVAAIDLSGVWTLKAIGYTYDLPAGLSAGLPVEIPGDVFSAILAGGVLPDPFYADNELQWLPFAQHYWIIRRSFEVREEDYRAPRIVLDAEVVDTVADIHINGKAVADSNSMFVPVCADVKSRLRVGTNEIVIHLLPAELIARSDAAKLPYPIPCSEFPIQSPHRNLLRKVQCHGGWDWGPALMTAGVYRSIQLVASPVYVVRAFHCDIQKRGARWVVTVHVDVHSEGGEEVRLAIAVAKADGGSQAQARAEGEGDAEADVREDVREEKSCQISGGDNHLEISVTMVDPRLWWPAGHGGQPHYTLALEVGELRFERRIAFRTVKIKNVKDRYGKSLRMSVNGRPIMITGANWIPCDALPSRQSDEKMRGLLLSARAAHINMVRVWGGGQYESEGFYRCCSELGILVWQDFMFSCSLYPADPSFLALVRQEAEAQIKRLKDFPCIALWCGNNENLGALTWFPESKKNRDAYVVDYDRLNEGVLGEAVRRLDPQRVFWPSSPCGGANDYSDNWHNDDSGDMHFWSVWHEGKSFDAYYSVIPRFCSEFGFQSFPSARVAKTFAPPEAFNPTHPYFEHHQRHPRGNTIILETIGRYFRFPDTFANIIYLSQLQQGLAIQTAVEYWRFHRERCGGMMYWQLNDVWPGTSWSSLEYGGGWKLLHYMARRFYSPLHIAAFRDPKSNRVVCAAYNESPEERAVSMSLVWYRGDGERIGDSQYKGLLEAQSVEPLELDRRDAGAIREGAMREGAILHMTLVDEQNNSTENVFLYDPPKRYSLPASAITLTDVVAHDAPPPAYFPNADRAYAITLASSGIALYVTLEIGGQFSHTSDNAFFLAPDTPKTVLCYVDSSEISNADQLREQVRIFDVAHSYRRYDE